MSITFWILFFGTGIIFALVVALIIVLLMAIAWAIMNLFE